MISNKFLRNGLLRILVGVVFLVSVFVWPVPKEAKADQLVVTFLLNWNNFVPSDAQMTCQQITAAGIPVGALKSMVPDTGYENWAYTFPNMDASAVGVRFNWIPDGNPFINGWTGPQGDGDRNPPLDVAIVGGLASGYAEAH